MAGAGQQPGGADAAGRPTELIEADWVAMLPLPAAPPQLGWQHQVRLGRAWYVRVDASDYSVDPAVIGQLAGVTADLDRVRARPAGTWSPIMSQSGRAGSP
jgi:hypothetical protein